MNHSEAVSTVTSLMPRFPAAGVNGVQDVLTKYARAHDLAPAQLAKLGTVYNTISSLSTYERSADRGANAHQIDVGRLVAGYADKPMRKAASSDPLPTHGEHVDLYNMFRQTLHEERAQMPDEAEKDEKKETHHATHKHQVDAAPDEKLLKAAAEDLDNTLDVQALDILRVVRKEAGVYNLAYADEDARHAVDGRFVDAAMRRISAHAAGMGMPARVVGMTGPLEKRAFAITSPVGNLLIDMAFNVAALDATVRMHKEAVDKPYESGRNPDPHDAPKKKSEEGDWDALAAEERAVHKARQYSHAGGSEDNPDWMTTGDETPTPASSKGALSQYLDILGTVPKPAEEPKSRGLFGDLKTGDLDDTTAPVDQPGEIPIEGEDQGDAHPTDEPNATPTDRPSGRKFEPDTDHGKKPEAEKDGKPGAPPKKVTVTETHEKAHHAAPRTSAKSAPVGTHADKGPTPGDFLRHAISLPAAGVGMLQQALTSAAHGARQHITDITSAPRQNNDQARVDKSVDDIRRSFILRKVMHNDHVLREADPQKVTRYYNELSDAYPELATNPEALTLSLREAVAYDGIPAETIKNLTSTRLDAARAHSEESKVRSEVYRI